MRAALLVLAEHRPHRVGDLTHGRMRLDGVHDWFDEVRRERAAAVTASSDR